jgi:alanyl-tRNA synthetase
MTASEILNKYISFFEKRGHTRIENSSLVPLNDPTTLFTSSGMQPLVPFLLGEPHPSGKRLVNAQNSFRAQDIDEIGDNRHTTFFRMLGNWSLGDYFKDEQIPWLFEFLTSRTEGLGLPPEKLFSTVFEGGDGVEKDAKSIELWQQEFKKIGIDAKVGEKIFTYGATKNWWSRAGIPSNMPVGEPGGPDTEVFFDYGEDLKIHEGSDFKEEKCHVNCDCGRYIEICNSVFMQYKKQEDGSLQPLPKPNVDFGGGLERLLMASEEKQDIFQTSLFLPIISAIEELTSKEYFTNKKEMRIVSDHFIASVFISSNGVKPSNKEQGYILRRLIRRGLDNFYLLSGKDISPILEKIVEQYSLTDPILIEQFVEIKNTILEEEQMYQRALSGGKKLIEKELSRAKDQVTVGDELMGVTLITAELAFKSMASYGLGPTQLKSLGYTFDDKELADLIKKHQENSRAGAQQKFAGGLADHSELTVKGHTATHLMHQALRDVLGDSVHQTGSNITSERVRFDFVYDKKVSSEELQKVKEIVDEKIKDDLPVHFEIMPLKNARELGAIGLFDDKYAKDVKIYFIGGSNPYSEKEKAYSIEFCGGPHVEHTGLIKSFDILKEEGVARGVRRLYVKVS